MTITSDNASTAWENASRYVLENGTPYADMLEVLNGVVTISSETFPFDPKFDLKFREIFGDDRIDYASQYTFVNPTVAEDGSYVYTPIKARWNETYFGRMVKYRGEFNQLDNVIKTLKKGMNVKRCEIIIYDPLTDAKNMYSQPCLLAIDIKPRNRVLTMSAFFRSQAISKSGYADYTALIRLGKFLGEASDNVLKTIVVYATSLHIRKQNKELHKTKAMLEFLENK
jgi:thymidylate synthase